MPGKYLIFLFVFFSSCEGLLFEEEDNEHIVIDTGEEKIEMLNGIYGYLTRVHNSYYFSALARSDDVNIYNNYGFYYTGQTGTVGCGRSNGSGNLVGIPEEMYLHLYYAILNANTMINQLHEDTDAPLIGECYFLRAYCYLKLARLFGTPPLVTDIDVSYTLEKPDYRQVYELIESDLLKALDLLPPTHTEARIPMETPHRGTAKALLAEVYLSMAGFPVNDNSKYAESARYAGEVIDEAEYYNFKLLEDMADLWKNNNRHHAENVFGLFYSGEDDENSNYIGANFVSINNDRQFELTGEYKADFNFFNAFPNNYRKWVSVVTGRYENVTYDTLGGYEYSRYFRVFDPSYNACYYLDHAVTLKWLDVEAVSLVEPDYYYPYNNQGTARKVTLCLLRYAHTLLTYAEARTRAGEMDAKCFEAVNKIRRRANKLPIDQPSEYDLPSSLSSEQFLDSVVWERAWELYMEPDGRWFDIVRLELRTQLAENRYRIDIPSGVDDADLNEDWYFYLIPQHDRWLNPNYAD